MEYLDNDVLKMVADGVIFDDENLYIDPFEPDFNSFDRGDFEDLFNQL